MYKAKLTIRYLSLWAAFFACATFSACAKEDHHAAADRSLGEKTARSCERIVSLAPSITEMLFALGLGERVVGVTEYCNYPPAAKSKAVIGGYATPNYELIVDLRPDVVFLLDLHQQQVAYLEDLEKPTVTCKSEFIADIIESLRTIGDYCGVENRAAEIVQSMENRLKLIGERTKGRVPPKVLVSLGRSMGTGTLQEVFAAGTNTFFNEVIELAGGQNAVGTRSIVYPRLSAEGIIALNPDVIVDLVVGMEDKQINKEQIRALWHDTPQINAVKNNRLHVFSQDYVVIPGPRIVLLVERLAEVLHPDIGWASR